MSKLLDILFKKFKTFQLEANVNIIYTDIDTARLYFHTLSETYEKNYALLPPELLSFLLEIKEINSKTKRGELLEWLGRFNYSKVDSLTQRKEYIVKGDVITIWPSYGDNIYQINFFDEILEDIKGIDFLTRRASSVFSNILLIDPSPVDWGSLSFEPVIIGSYSIFCNSASILFNKTSIIEHMSQIMQVPEATKPVMTLDMSEKYKFDSTELPFFNGNYKVFSDYLSSLGDVQSYYIGSQWDILDQKFTKQLSRIDTSVKLERGHYYPEAKVVLVTDRELFSRINLRKDKSKLSSKFKKLFDNEVNVNDFVVHEAHGVGVYKGIDTRFIDGLVKEYAVIEYLNEDKLLVPLDQLDRLSKYLSADGSDPKLTKLGTVEWETVKRKLKKSVEDIAKGLLEIYAKKTLQKGIAFASKATEFDLDKDFGYELTDDQKKTLNEVFSDMESDKPMDRLIIGDVGFGKTEIALRATWKALASKYQVMVLAPTTVLVAQLYNVFEKRLGKYGAKVVKLSRFDGTIKNKKNVELFNSGKINIVIGTHRLLSKDIKPKKLGLLIVDEEQRFGVKQKEKIRKLATNIDILSMSATPIPRTLQMSLTGIKDISIIATPPKNRVNVKNELIFKEEVSEKIVREIERNGQVFIIHNKIETIYQFAQEIKEELKEEVKIEVAYGQMKGEKLEEIMLRFQERDIDILIATTIIENGIDIPTVNTIIINNAQNFGLAQLYQLRGRVGRSDVQAYCYLVVPKTKEFIKLHSNPSGHLKKFYEMLEQHKIDDNWINEDAVARVQAILENQELGAGFKIASRDLEIRGSGNILGSEQSGHINAVGYEMYIRLLEQEIDRIRKIQF